MLQRMTVCSSFYVCAFETEKSGEDEEVGWRSWRGPVLPEGGTF